MKRACFIILGLMVFLRFGLGSSPTQIEPEGDLTSEQVREMDAFSLGIQAYIWGFPAWMDEQNTVMIVSVEEPDGMRAPWNMFLHATKVYGPDYRFVQTPNNNIINSTACLDLGHEPMIFYVPDFKGRFYTFQLIDKYTNNFGYISQRTKGFREQVYALCGPGWPGKLPPGVERIDVPTVEMTIGGRIGIDGEQDLPEVRALQARIRLVPLSQFGKDYMPGKVPVPKWKQYTGPLAYFECLGDIISKNRPPAHERGLMGLFERIGLSPDYGFDPARLDEATKRGLERAIPVARAIIELRSKTLSKLVNGWSMLPALKEYFGTSYLDRAAVAWQYIYANSPEEAAYATAWIDDQGEALDASKHKYVFRLPKDHRPPVDGFWSVTMYGTDGYMVENPIKHYSLGSRTKGLKYEADGSLTICIQNDSPGREKESNWLPAPKDRFYLFFRMYLPKQEVLNGQYEFPPVKRVKPAH
jgi:hypothetical protein